MSISSVSAGQYYNLPTSATNTGQTAGAGQVLQRKDMPTNAPVHHRHHHAQDVTSASNSTDSLFGANNNNQSAIEDPSSALQASFAGGSKHKQPSTSAEDGALLDLFA